MELQSCRTIEDVLACVQRWKWMFKSDGGFSVFNDEEGPYVPFNDLEAALQRVAEISRGEVYRCIPKFSEIYPVTWDKVVCASSREFVGPSCQKELTLEEAELLRRYLISIEYPEILCRKPAPPQEGVTK